MVFYRNIKFFYVPQGFTDRETLLYHPQNFNMIDGEKISAMLPTSWKKSFIKGIVIPAKKRFCNECSKEKCFNGCNNQINVSKEVKANLNLLKRQAPNDFGSMLSYFKE